MKILTKEQEAAHYNETLKGGAAGGLAGLGLGTAGVLLASRRYQFFRGLTIPLRAFLITSAATFGGIVTADHWSRAYEKAVNPIAQEYEQHERDKAQKAAAGKSFTEKAMEFGKQERYKIVGASWLASMVAAFTLVNRNPYLSGQQKLVQARVYAQFLTLGVLIASAAFELSDKNNETGRYETVKYIDPKDPEHKRMIERKQEVPSGDPGDELWKDMIKAEEERLKQREEDEQRLRKKHKTPSNDEKKDNKKADKKDDKKDGKKDDKKDDKKEDKKDNEKDQKAVEKSAKDSKRDDKGKDEGDAEGKEGEKESKEKKGKK